MGTKKRFTRKTNKPNPNGNYISPLLRQDDEIVENNQRIAFDFDFPSISKHINDINNSKISNEQNSNLFQAKPSEGVTLPHSLLVQPVSGFNIENSKTSFNFTTTTTRSELSISQTSKSSKEMEAIIPTTSQKELPLITARPINELLEVPLESLKGSKTKKQKKNQVIEKPLSKVSVESQQTSNSTKVNQINISTVEIKVEGLIKNEPNMIDSESSSESSSSEDEVVEFSKVPILDENVIVLEDSASEDENVNVTGAVEQEDGTILLEDSEVDTMILNQELNTRFQSNQELLNNFRNQIFVGNLPSSIKRLHVFKFFERYGNITDLKFIRSKVKKTTICFITYKDHKSVYSAFEANGLLFCGHNFRVTRVGRSPVIVDCTVVVYNLPNDTSSQNLHDVFEVCGLIRSDYLVKTEDKVQAYITFELEISAAYAVLLNNFHLKGRQLYVHQYINQRERQGLSNKIT